MLPTNDVRVDGQIRARGKMQQFWRERQDSQAARKTKGGDVCNERKGVSRSGRLAQIDTDAVWSMFIAAREGQTRMLLLLGFGVLAVGASLVTLLAVRVVWRDWSTELRLL